MKTGSAEPTDGSTSGTGGSSIERTYKNAFVAASVGVTASADSKTLLSGAASGSSTAMSSPARGPATRRRTGLRACESIALRLMRSRNWSSQRPRCSAGVPGFEAGRASVAIAVLTTVAVYLLFRHLVAPSCKGLDNNKKRPALRPTARALFGGNVRYLSRGELDAFGAGVADAAGSGFETLVVATGASGFSA